VVERYNFGAKKVRVRACNRMQQLRPLRRQAVKVLPDIRHAAFSGGDTHAAVCPCNQRLEIPFPINSRALGSGAYPSA